MKTPTLILAIIYLFAIGMIDVQKLPKGQGTLGGAIIFSKGEVFVLQIALIKVCIYIYLYRKDKP